MSPTAYATTTLAPNLSPTATPTSIISPFAQEQEHGISITLTLTWRELLMIVLLFLCVLVCIVFRRYRKVDKIDIVRRFSESGEYTGRISVNL